MATARVFDFFRAEFVEQTTARVIQWKRWYSGLLHLSFLINFLLHTFCHKPLQSSTLSAELLNSHFIVNVFVLLMHCSPAHF